MSDASPDIYDVLTAPDEAMAAQRAAALRGVIDRDKLFGMGFQASGLNTMAPIGRQLTAGAQAMNEDLGKAPVQRGAIALNAAHAAKFQADADRENQAWAAKMRGAPVLRRAIGMMAPELKNDPSVQNADALTLEGLVGPLEKIRQTQIMGQARVDAAQAGREFAKTYRDAALEQQRLRFAAQRANEFGRALDDWAPRGGMKGLAEGVQRAKKLDAMLTQKDWRGNTTLKDIVTPQDMAEATIALQQLVAQGHPSEHEVQSLMPQSIGQDVARATQYFTEHPVDANTKAWVRRMLHTAHREADVSRQAMLNAYRSRIPQFNDYRQLDPGNWSSMLQAHDIDPEAFDANGLVIPGKQFWKNGALYSDNEGGQPGAGGPVRVQTQAQRDALPPGTQYVGPDGVTYTKR